MGMFDEIIIHNKFLPEEFHDERIKWQTKDFDCVCEVYEVLEDGKLVKFDWITGKPIDTKLTQGFNLYTLKPGGLWIEFAALVENGFLKTLIRCQDEKI